MIPPINSPPQTDDSQSQDPAVLALINKIQTIITEVSALFPDMKDIKNKINAVSKEATKVQNLPSGVDEKLKELAKNADQTDPQVLQASLQTVLFSLKK